MIEGARPLTLVSDGLSFSAWEMGEGPLVICLHGFPDTAGTWRFLLPDLAAAGFRAVAVTSRGYEPGSQPADGDFSVAALSADVVGWIDALGEKTAHLVGHDWGASLAFAASARAPDRIASVTALAVPHPAGFAAQVIRDFDQMARSWYVYAFQATPFANAILEADDFALLEHLWRRWSPGWSPDPLDLRRVRRAFSEPGVTASTLAYYRTGFDAAHPRAAESAALVSVPLKAPVLGISGEQDGCVSADVFEASMPAALFPAGVTVERWADAGHFLHLEQPGRLSARVIDWLHTRAAAVTDGPARP